MRRLWPTLGLQRARLDVREKEQVLRHCRDHEPQVDGPEGVDPREPEPWRRPYDDRSAECRLAHARPHDRESDEPPEPEQPRRKIG
ncbi:hypothetical protein [Mumia zhuanghuii]|uniref:Uncharacterized protein n=1 Tax=Mumia zhuanghuii TaxID=2585211 RepID=A0A5C4MC55_9ACTN|nr:hypothetical protein [Mumia zhuanghuii]TNC31314.1 hypothetical protein FHE65_32105 [Mumia zhuanghuii]